MDMSQTLAIPYFSPKRRCERQSLIYGGYTLLYCTKWNENVILDVWHNGLPPELFCAAAPRRGTYLPSVQAP